MYVSRYIEDYWKSITSKLKEFDDISIVDKLFYFNTGILEDHSNFRQTVAEQIANNRKWAAVGVNRGPLRATEGIRGFEIGIEKLTKIGGNARILEFDLSVQILTNSALFMETFETYYVCELFKNLTLALEVQFNPPIGQLTVSCEHSEINESSSVGFDEKTAGLFKVGYSVKLTGLAVSPYEKVAPYVHTVNVKFPE